MHQDSASNRKSARCAGTDCRRTAFLFLALLFSASTALICRYLANTVTITLGDVTRLWMNPNALMTISYSLNNTKSYGYIVSNAFSGQQGSGVRALLSLQCWAASFALPMYIVEPYIEKSSLSTRRQHNEIKNPMTFGDFFDLRHFNMLSVNEGRPPLVSWETFMQNAPRQVVVARIHNDLTCHRIKEPFFRVVEEGQAEGCFAPKWLHNPQLQGADFCIVRVVILWGCLSRPDAIKKMRSFLFDEWAPDQVTLVLRMWAATWGKLQNPGVTGKLACNDTGGRFLQHRLHPSPRLLREAQYYTSAFLGSRNRVAVMIRSEQAIRGFAAQSGDRLDSLGMCLQKSYQLVKSLMQENQTENESMLVRSPAGVFLTLDIGKYGSNSMDWVLGLDKYNLTNRSSEVMEKVKEFVHTLYDGKWKFSDWESSFTKATGEANNLGYIASLQRTIASQADCLVLMGGGDYQRLAMIDYLENHSKPSQLCLYLVCFSKSYQQQFTNLVQEAYDMRTLNSTMHFHVL